MNLTPRPAQLREHVANYIADAESIFTETLAKARKSTAFGEIYHVSLSTDTVLRGLSGPTLKPKVAGARSIALRLPLLVSVGQQSVATVDLRRVVELIFWTIYFSDHPVEWRSFNAESGSGFSRDTRKPISYSAHRELAYYLDYAKELMNSEESGLGNCAVDGVRQACHELNAVVHAGQMAKAAARKPPHEDISEPDLRKFGDLQRRVFANCSVVFAAYNRRRFDQLGAGARAHFDWLVGLAIRKKVRQGPFGIRKI